MYPISLRATVACLLFLALATPVSADPSTTDPESGLSAHDTIGGAAARVEQMYEKFYEWEKLCITSLQNMEQGKRVPHAELSRIMAEIYRGIWYAEDLELMGEPAGADLLRRFTLLRPEYRKLFRAVLEHQPKELTKLNRSMEKRNKTLQRAQELVADGKLAEAEKILQELHLETIKSAFYFNDSNWKKYLNPVGAPHREVRSRLRSERRQFVKERAQDKIDQCDQVIETLRTEAERVVSELAKAPAAQLGEENSGGVADAIGYVGKLWGNASASITRGVGRSWATGGRAAFGDAERFAAKVKQAESIAVEAIEKLIVASGQLDDEEFASTYPRILIELSVLDRRYLENLSAKFQPTLDQVLQGRSEYAAAVARYSDATAEPSRWMRRYALRQLKGIEKDYVGPEFRLKEEHEVTQGAAPEIYRRYSRGKRVVTPGTLNGPASWTADDAKVLLGSKVQQRWNIRPSTEIPLTVSRMGEQHYCHVDISKQSGVNQSIAELQRALLVDDQYGPLDLSAADAYSAATLREFDQVGGTISALTLQGFATRLATLPDVVHATVPLDLLPPMSGQGDATTKLVWRVDLEPDWVFHRLFFANVE